MRKALIGILMAATVATPLAAQTAEQSTERRGGFGSRVRDAVRSERADRQRTEQPRSEGRDSDEGAAIPSTARRDRRQAARQERDERASQDRPRTWGQSVNRAIQNEQRQDRERARLERQRELERYRDWRYDSRYDWERWRYANRGLYGSGRYYSPWNGYRYRPLSIGVRLGSPFYSHRYWISDPWQYRLPPAYPGTRWVRYYDDVVLVDMYDGEVLDIIRNFFW